MRHLIPNSTQIPDVILDLWMGKLSGAEFKVVLYIARRTYGFGRTGDTISLKQISAGLVTRDGRRLDHGTGLNKDTVVNALARLEKIGAILREQRRHEEYGDLANFYQLNLDCEDWWSDDSDDSPPAKPLNKLFEAIFRLERHLVGRVPMTPGVSILTLAVAKN